MSVFQQHRRQITATEDAVVASTFRAFASSDGYVKQSIIPQLMHALGHEITAEEAEQLAREIGVDSRETLSADDFEKLLSLYREAARYKMLRSNTKLVLSKKERLLLSDSYIVSAWQLAMLVFALYHWLIVLYTNTINDEKANHLFQRTTAVEVILTIIYGVDIAVSARTTSSKVSEGVVSKEYLLQWAFFDIIALLPMHLMTGTILAQRILFHFRLAKLFKTSTYFAASGRGNITTVYVYFYLSFVPVVRALFYFVLLIHLSSVVFVFIQRIDRPQFGYVESLYFVAYSFSGVGYGHISATTTIDRIARSMMCLVAVGATSYVVGSMVQAIDKTDVELHKQQQVTYALGMTKLANLPQPLANDVIGYKADRENDSLTGGEHMQASNLPLVLQHNITLFARMRLIADSTLFRSAHRSLHVAVAEELRVAIARPNEMIFMIGDRPNRMFFISHGFVRIITSEGTTRRTLGHGDSFGEGGLLRANDIKYFSAQSVSYTELYYLDRGVFALVLQQFPLSSTSLRLFAQEREKMAEAMKLTSIDNDGRFDHGPEVPCNICVHPARPSISTIEDENWLGLLCTPAADEFDNNTVSTDEDELLTQKCLQEMSQIESLLSDLREMKKKQGEFEASSIESPHPFATSMQTQVPSPMPSPNVKLS